MSDRQKRSMSITHLEEKLDRALFDHATLRPHQGLAGATPTEVCFGLTPATLPARRGRPRPVRPPGLPFEVTWLERRLPFSHPDETRRPTRPLSGTSGCRAIA